jgi:hypothetical protein
MVQKTRTPALAPVISLVPIHMAVWAQPMQLKNQRRQASPGHQRKGLQAVLARETLLKYLTKLAGQFLDSQGVTLHCFLMP